MDGDWRAWRRGFGKGGAEGVQWRGIPSAPPFPNALPPYPEVRCEGELSGLLEVLDGQAAQQVV